MGNIAITSKIAYSSSAWDLIIESFPGGWDKELREFVLARINITGEEVDNLINRWKRYFFIWLDPWEGWDGIVIEFLQKLLLLSNLRLK